MTGSDNFRTNSFALVSFKIASARSSIVLGDFWTKDHQVDVESIIRTRSTASSKLIKKRVILGFVIVRG